MSLSSSNVTPSSTSNSTHARNSIAAVDVDTPSIGSPIFRLRKHADYQRVYKASRKQFSKQMAYFFALRPAVGADGTPLRDVGAASPRVGLTVGKVMGKAVDRNRIKRRMREAVRGHLDLLHAPVDLILHPKRSVIDLESAMLHREVADVFRGVQRACDKLASAKPAQPAPSVTA